MKIFKDYAQFYDLIYKQKSYKEEATFVYKWANKPKTILDLGCGTGKHIYYLASKTEQIIGIDASLEMLSWAYMRTKKFNNVKYIFNKTNKRLLDLPKVDCVMALFNVVGYIGLEKCLKYIPLKRNGYFIYDIWDKNKVQKYGFMKIEKIFKWGKILISPVWNNLNVVKLLIEIKPKKGDSLKEFHFIKFYSLKDINIIGKKYGYKVIETKPTETWVKWFKLQKL